MSQDYAKRAAQHKQQMSKKSRSPVPKGLTLATCFALIAFIGFLYYLTQISPQPKEPDSATSKPASQQKVTPATAQPRKAPQVTESEPEDEYDFYKLLPESEVIPPKVEEYRSQPVDPTKVKTYLLQAGSFRNPKDADRLRAKLILEGLQVDIKQVSGRGGGHWYRVLVGPFQSRSKLNHAQDILAAANTESMLIEVKQ